ncbi:MAG TPA: hypothetical protein PKL52_01830 [Tenuifilaceae bacterium]|jgi:hypothetical protein|nr:hypothetical protein [Tenuifilaceae bacterium]
MARFKLEDRVRLKSTGVEYSISATISVFEGGNINLVYELTEGEKDAWGAYINTGERYRENELEPVDVKRTEKDDLKEELGKLTGTSVPPYVSESVERLTERVNEERAKKELPPIESSKPQKATPRPAQARVVKRKK